MIDVYQYDLFISYSSNDKEIVHMLAGRINELGFKVWLDEWEISIGDKVLKRISEGLEKSALVAVWISEYSIKSNWVEDEWLSKYHEGIANRDIAVLPLLGQKVEIPYLLRKVKQANFYTDFEEGFERLVTTLNKLSDKTINSLKNNLIGGVKPEETVKRIIEIILSRHSFLGLEVLWESIITTAHLSSIVDHCAWGIGKVMLESNNSLIIERALSMVLESVKWEVDLIQEKFAYTSMRIYDHARDTVLKERILAFISLNINSMDQRIRFYYNELNMRHKLIKD